MSGPQGDSAATRQVILAAARELFAARGVDGVSVRQIAAAGGVNHALVHRYFGAKSEMVAAILEAEAEAMSSIGRPDAGAVESLAAFRDVLDYVLAEGRTSLLLMLRAELDGLGPERLLEGSPLRPLDQLQGWLAGHRSAAAGFDPQALAMVLGAAIMGLAALQPMLAAGVGLADADPDDVRRRCVDALLGVTAAAIRPPASSAGEPQPGPEPDQTGGPES
jgi:TetR/AcrR family transcriptional regulator, repressor for neighboring sulfatase